MAGSVGVAVELKEPGLKCKLCFRSVEPRLGPLYEYVVRPEIDVYRAHYFCLIFSAGLGQIEEDENVGIKGFLPEDILKEWRRGQRLKCSFCDQKFATLGCSKKRCSKVYHLPCAMDNGVLLEYLGNFNTHCSGHRPLQVVTFEKEGARNECGVCLESLGEPSALTLWTPCCGSWAHNQCVRVYAESAGYFFKCPLCNDAKIFPDEMRRFGVHVPEKDAAWEEEPDAFAELTERHGRCDVEGDCQCPDGREFDVDYTLWEIVLCQICGSSGIHIQCGNLPLEIGRIECPKWTCRSCISIEEKLPVHYFHSFKKWKDSPRKKKSSSNNKTSFLQKLTFRICEGEGPSVISAELANKTTISIARKKAIIPFPVECVVPKVSNQEKEDERIPAEPHSPSNAAPLEFTAKNRGQHSVTCRSENSDEDSDLIKKRKICLSDLSPQDTNKKVCQSDSLPESRKQTSILNFFSREQKT